MAKLRIFCVIPGLNESAHIAKVVSEVKPFVDHVIVVDDGSADNTSQLAQSAGAIVIRHRLNIGQGGALRTGTLFALRHGADIIVHFDADGQFIAQEIPQVVAPIISGEAQIVFGSRFLTSAPNTMPWVKKHVLMPLGRMFNRSILGITTSDPQSGFRAFSAQAYSVIAWRHYGYAHASEILSLACASKMSIAEVPITVLYNRFGQGLGGGIKIVKDFFLEWLSD
ncbi:MAG: glycosyltransferase family 2 protein [Candidatus Falkowbacteria bacterium]